jgi:hypothetical protein
VHLAWAFVPLGLTILLVWQAAGEDSYIADGRSNWTTHPDGQVVVAAAVLLNVLTVAVLLVSRGERPVWLIGAGMTLVGVLATAFAILAIGAH